jgi:hypothetical protein
MAVVAICQSGALLCPIPSVENVKLTKMQGESRSTEITHGDGVRSLITAVFACAELLELTQQRAPLFWGLSRKCTRPLTFERATIYAKRWPANPALILVAVAILAARPVGRRTFDA